MLCEKCKKQEATIHLTEIVKSIKSEVHLCEKCAREVGLNTKVSNFTLSLPEILTFLDVKDVDDVKDATVCPSCGCTFLQYKRDGSLGCLVCYIALADLLKPVMVNFHGDKRYMGKSPLYSTCVKYNSEIKSKEATDLIESSILTISDLKFELTVAVKDERYEDAALLRDRIKLLSGSLKQDSMALNE